MDVMSKVSKKQINSYIIKTVKQFFVDYQIDQKRPFTLAVSGGLDSMCLLNVFEHLFSIGFISSINVVHFNHQMREESDTEEKELSKFLKSKTIPFLTKKLFLGNKSNKEMLAREARYAFLDKFLDSNNSYCCLGHHLNDHFEWSLMRMLRSSDTEFFQGMPKVRGAYLRPFSEISRDELQLYAEVNNLVFWEDESNKDECFDRNFIRQELVTKMTERFPNCLEHYRSRQSLSKRKNYLPSKMEILEFSNNGPLGFFIDHEISHLDLDLIGSCIKKLSFVNRGSISRELIKLENAFFSGKQGPMMFSGEVKVWLNRPFIFIYSCRGGNDWQTSAQPISLNKITNRFELIDLVRRGEIYSPFLRVRDEEIVSKLSKVGRKIPTDFDWFLGAREVFSLGALYNSLPRP